MCAKAARFTPLAQASLQPGAPNCRGTDPVLRVRASTLPVIRRRETKRYTVATTAARRGEAGCRAWRSQSGSSSARALAGAARGAPRRDHRGSSEPRAVPVSPSRTHRGAACSLAGRRQHLPSRGTSGRTPARRPRKPQQKVDGLTMLLPAGARVARLERRFVAEQAKARVRRRPRRPRWSAVSRERAADAGVADAPAPVEPRAPPLLRLARVRRSYARIDSVRSAPRPTRRGDRLRRASSRASVQPARAERGERRRARPELPGLIPGVR